MGRAPAACPRKTRSCAAWSIIWREKIASRARTRVLRQLFGFGGSNCSLVFDSTLMRAFVEGVGLLRALHERLARRAALAGREAPYFRYPLW